MTKPDAGTLMVRSLNETRLLHPPTYVALRLLADSIASEATSGWTPEAVLRKFPLQRTPRLFEIVRLKKAPPGQQLEYRHYLIPSPMAALARLPLQLSVLPVWLQAAQSRDCRCVPEISRSHRRRYGHPSLLSINTARPLKGSVLFRARPERCRCTGTRYSWDAIASHHSSFQRTWYSHGP